MPSLGLDKSVCQVAFCSCPTARKGHIRTFYNSAGLEVTLEKRKKVGEALILQACSPGCLRLSSQLPLVWGPHPWGKRKHLEWKREAGGGGVLQRYKK